MRTTTIHFLPLAALALLLSGCDGPDERVRPANNVGQRHTADTLPASFVKEQGSAPYDFSQPTTSHSLPGRLVEISGIDFAGEQLLAAIEDEEGILYLIDFETGDVEAERRFGKKGDYEDLAFVDDHLYVLRSDGTLFEIEDWDKKKPDRVKRHTVSVPKGCDAEGLARVPGREHLLIACKERAGKGLKDQRAIYAYDLRRKKLVKDPVYVIFMDELDQLLAGQAGGNGAEGFKPSAIRFHPITGELYVLSSVTKVLTVLSPDGRLRAVYPLSGRLLPQPEGLAFLPGGDLFISSEGGGKGDGTLHRFGYLPAS